MKVYGTFSINSTKSVVFPPSTRCLINKPEPPFFPRFLVRLGSLYCLYEEVMQSKNEGENGWQQWWTRVGFSCYFSWKYRVSPVYVFASYQSSVVAKD